MPTYYDAFISYGRANSKEFAIKLNQRLEQENLKIWFDQNDLPPAVDWQGQINDGIERAHNFLFIISPHSVKSEYCLKEIELAVKLNKRILPLLHVNADAEYDLMHPIIKERNWLSEWLEASENFDFEQSFQKLLVTLKKDANYVKQHTKYLISALQWQRNQQQTQYLLTGEDRVKAESWLKVKFTQGKQAPCIPTDLHCQYICESTKNANNLLTQVFICHNELDNQERDKLVKALNRQGIVSWTNKTDIQSGKEFQEEINKGIEGADNFVYLLSPNSVSCNYCKQELAHALKYNKRIIPILIKSFDLTTIPPEIKDLQFIDFLPNSIKTLLIKESEEGISSANKLDELIKVIKEDANYYYLHKILLVKALKWLAQNRNRSLLLRGYNLQKFEAWLNTGLPRKLHPPLQLQSEFIQASKEQTTEEVLDVFISYSRADADFARKLNDSLQELGKTTWFDQESIAVGEDFKKEIEKGIESCDNFVFIISPSSVSSPYCADEVEYASGLNKRLITILLKSVNPNSLHPSLAKIQWIDFRQRDFYLHFNEMVRVLDTDRDHVRNHSKWSQRALEWQENRKKSDFLLRGTELITAQAWLKETEINKKLPLLTELQKEYVRKSRNQKLRNRSLMIGGIITALITLTTLWLRAEKQTIIANLKEKAAKAEILFSTADNVDGLVLAIAATGESQTKLGKVIVPVLHSLFEGTQTVREKNLFTDHTGHVNSVQFSPDGKYIISGSEDKTLRLWDLHGNPVGKPFIGHTSSVMSVQFSPDGKYIISGSEDKTLRLWDLHGNPVGKPFIGHTSSVMSVQFSPDGKYIISGSEDKTLRLWDTQGNLRGKPFTGHTSSVMSVQFSPDGKYIISGSKDKTIRLWDLQGNPVGKPFTGHTEGVYSVTFSSDGKYIITGSFDKTLGLWETQNNTKNIILVGHTDGVYSVAFSSDGKYIVSASKDNTIRIWENDQSQPLLGHSNSVASVAFSPNSKYIVSGSFDNTVRLWNLQGHLPVKSFLSHNKEIYAVVFSPNGKYIVSAGFDHTLRSWNLEGNSIGKPFTGHTDSVNSVAFSPDGKYIVSGSKDHTLRLWNLQGNSIRNPFIGHTDSVMSVQFSPDGKYIVSGSKDHTLRLWDLQGNLMGTPFIGHTDSINSVAFSPDGKYIVSGSSDNTLRLWDLQGNLMGTPFIGHTDSINSVAFSPNGKYIVSGSHDNTMRLWDLQGNSIGIPFTDYNNSINCVTFSPDGKYIISGSGNKSIRLWEIGWRAWLKAGCNQLKEHPVLTNPQTENQKEAREACEKYG